MFITASNLKKSFFKIASIFIVSFNFAFATNLYYSGVCFVGNASEFDVLFPYSKTIDDKTEGALDKFVYPKILEATKDSSNFDLKTSDLADLSGANAYVLAFAIDGENLSISESELEKGNLFDLRAELSAQILVFDYKTRNIVFNYPVVAQYTSATRGEPPSREFISNMFETMLLDADSKVNIFNLLIGKLDKIELNNDQIFRVGVGDVILSESSFKRFPEDIKKSPGILKRQLGQSLVAALASNCEINVLPFIGNTSALTQESDEITNTNAAIGGKMLTRFSNGDIFELTVPEADYSVNLTLRGFSHKLGKATNVQQLVVYGSYINLELSQPFSGQVYCNQNFKNVYVDSVIKGSPSSISRDWFCFNTATSVLFDGLTKHLSSPDKDWAKKFGGEGAFKQMKSASKIIKKCKL